ncbi:MAG: hypothetical protein ABSB96_06400 [Gaiellaceae bacterium]
MSGVLWYAVLVSLVVGVAIAALWAFLFLSRQIPELKEGRRDILFHIASELATAGLLITGALATIFDRQAVWSRLVSVFSLGALAYTLLNSPGYYADRGERPMLVMFGALWLLVLPVIIIRLVSG